MKIVYLYAKSNTNPVLQYGDGHIRNKMKIIDEMYRQIKKLPMVNL